MKKTILPLIALLSLAGNVNAQQPGGNDKANGLKKAVMLRPDVKKLIVQQLEQGRSQAQKTTASEVIIANYGYYDYSGSINEDSITFSYSGGRGNILNSFFDYFEYYNPLSTASRTNNPGETFLFDTAISYYATPQIPFVKQGMSNRSYDAADNIVRQDDWTYDAAGIIYGHRYRSMSYDANNNLLNAAGYVDTSATLTGIFELAQNLDANYASGTNRRVSDTIRSYWSPFIDKSFTSYTYDAAGRMTQSLTQDYDMSSASWLNNYQNIYSYDAAGRLVTAIWEYWNGNNWEIGNKDSMGYTGNATMYTLMEGTNYSGGMPTSRYRNIFTLNALQNVDSIYSVVEDTSGNWVPIARGKITYNSNQHATKYYEVTFDDNTNTWNTAPSAIYRWHYMATTSVKDAKKQQSNFVQYYPNPATQQLNLKIEQPKNGIRVSIYNLTGQLLQTLTQGATGLVQVDISALPAGTYIAEVSMNGQVQQSKFVKQ